MEVDGRMIRPRQATHEWQRQCPIGGSDSDNVGNDDHLAVYRKEITPVTWIMENCHGRAFRVTARIR